MEVRRSARVSTEFLVCIQGLEKELVLRRGNISTTGIYFVTEADVGEVGMMLWLGLSSPDGAKSVTVMAYVVRSVRLNDISGRELTGAAFEFIPENDAASAAVQEFVRYMLSLRRDAAAEPHVSARLDATTPIGDGATVSDLTVRSLTLETGWTVKPGETVLVDVFAPGMKNRLRMEGRAVRVAPRPPIDDRPRFQIDLDILQQTERPLNSMAPAAAGESMPPPSNVPLAIMAMDDAEVSQTIDDLLSALVLPQQPTTPRAPRRTHLSGILAQIPMTTLLSLFEMEQLTGKLVVRTGDAPCDIYMKDGRLLDVEPLADGQSPRDRLAALLMAREGSFEFYVQPVDREDRVGARTTALLLDISRVMDERNRTDTPD